jgi:hypothetical protein
MNHHILSFAVAAAAAFTALGAATPAAAQTETLGRCIADNTTGKDRRDLAKWVFLSMSAHPDMRSVASVAGGALDEASRTAAQLFTRLLADSCPKEANAALKAGGSQAMQAAFQTLGQLAMLELMSDKDVMAGMALLERHVDRRRLEALGR